MSNLIRKLEEYFETTPREKVLEDWEKSKEWDEVGLTVDHFLSIKESYLTDEYIKLIESVKININKKHGD